MLRQEGNVPAVIEGPTQADTGIGADQMRPPEYRLMQGQSAAVEEGLAKRGQFYSAELGQAKDSIGAVVLVNQVTRVLWNPDELGAPVCSSNDSITARPGSEYEGRKCSECPLRDNDCLTGMTMVALEDGDPERPFIFRAQAKTAITPAANFATAIRIGYGDRPYAAFTMFTSKDTTNAHKQTYSVPNMRPDAAKSKGLDVSAYGRLAASYVKRRDELGETQGYDSAGEPPPQVEAPAPTRPRRPRRGGTDAELQVSDAPSTDTGVEQGAPSSDDAPLF